MSLVQCGKFDLKRVSPLTKPFSVLFPNYKHFLILKVNDMIWNDSREVCESGVMGWGGLLAIEVWKIFLRKLSLTYLYHKIALIPENNLLHISWMVPLYWRKYFYLSLYFARDKRPSTLIRYNFVMWVSCTNSTSEISVCRKCGLAIVSARSVRGQAVGANLPGPPKLLSFKVHSWKK